MDNREKLCVESILKLMPEGDILSLAKTLTQKSTGEASLEGK